MKYNDYCQLLTINVNMPHCPEKLISVVQEDNKLTISSTKFTVKWLLQLEFPKDIEVDKDSVRQHFNGHLLSLSYKAHKKGDVYHSREERIADKLEQELTGRKQQKKQEEPAPEPKPEVQEAPENNNKIESKAEKLLKMDLIPKQPKVIQKDIKVNNENSRKKTRLISNVLKERRVKDENELMLKLARKAQKKQQERDLGKTEAIERKEQMVMNQLEAKKKRKEAKEAKTKAILKRIEDRKHGKNTKSKDQKNE